MTVEHERFTLHRALPAPPQRVWTAWTEPSQKRRWFADGNGPGWTVLDYSLDPREGGQELAGFRFNDDPLIRYAARLIELRENTRLIYAYEMLSDGSRISASLVTVTFATCQAGTDLTYTEQIAFLDGADSLARRIPGTDALLDRLVHSLRPPA